MLFETVPPNPDPMFLEFQSSPHRERQRAYMLELWKRFEPYADRQFVAEFGRDFYGRYWEMVLGCALLDRGHRLVPATELPSHGPDLCIASHGARTWVEAIAPTAGEGPDAVTFSESEGGYVPEEKIVLRVTAAVNEKFVKLKQYFAKGIVAPGDSFVVALSTRRVPGAIFETRPPLAVQALYPIGPDTITVDVATGKVVRQGYAHRPDIRKASGTAVPTTTFLDPEYSPLSAVLTGNPDMFEMNKPLLRLFHNRNAAAPLPKGWLRRAQEWWLEANEIKDRWVE